MLGVVFTEFLEMVEDQFSADVADELLDNERLKAEGIYTAVGNYDHSDIVVMVGQLSKITGVDIDTLVQAFGRHLFGCFVARYPDFFENIDHPLDFLEGIEDRIHKQVRRLYPQAELPQFEPNRVSQNQLILDYRSTRPFSNLAVGLIEGCGAYFKMPLLIAQEHSHVDGEFHTQFDIRVAS